MTIITLIIDDTYGTNGKLYFSRAFDDKLKNKTIPKMIRYDVINPYLMRKYNKLTNSDFYYIIEQLYCAWRFENV